MVASGRFIYVILCRGHLVWLLPRLWLLFGGVVNRGFTVLQGELKDNYEKLQRSLKEND